MTQSQKAQQSRRAERAKTRMSTAALLVTGVVFGIVVAGIGIYLAVR
jgi:hypothetical protein